MQSNATTKQNTAHGRVRYDRDPGLRGVAFHSNLWEHFSMAIERKDVKKKPAITRATRFDPDPMTIAYIGLNATGKFEPVIIGIVTNESFSGCAVLIATNYDFSKGQTLRIKVGQLDALKAEVAWTKELEEDIKKLGIKFLE